MTPEIAKAAMQFMMRVTLEGQEVPAFNTVMQSLSEISASGAEKSPKKPQKKARDFGSPASSNESSAQS